MNYCRGKWIEQHETGDANCQCAKMATCKRYTVKPSQFPLNPGTYFDRVPWSVPVKEGHIRVECDYFIPDYDAIRKIKDRENK